MNLDAFLQRIRNGETIDFQETLSVIAQHYQYQPTEFSNGLNKPLLNPAGSNEGSCKIFSFAKLHNLTQKQTLALFGDYYLKDVLHHPDGSDHMNIRNFMRDGWEGIQFQGMALKAN